MIYNYYKVFKVASFYCKLGANDVTIEMKNNFPWIFSLTINILHEVINKLFFLSPNYSCIPI